MSVFWALHQVSLQDLINAAGNLTQVITGNIANVHTSLHRNAGLIWRWLSAITSWFLPLSYWTFAEVHFLCLITDEGDGRFWGGLFLLWWRLWRVMTVTVSSRTASQFNSLVTGSTALPVLSLLSHEVRSCPHTPAGYYSAFYSLWGEFTKNELHPSIVAFVCPKCTVLAHVLH